MTSVKRVVLACIACLATTAHADVPAPDACACSPNKPGFHRLDVLTGDWGGRRSDLIEDGIKFLATYSPELISAPAISDRPVVFAGLGALSVDLDLGKLATAGLGNIHISGFAIHGRPLSQRFSDVFTVSNNLANKDVRLFEAWLDQPLGPVSVRAGLLSADQQFTLATTSVVLMNATFGIFGMLSKVLSGPVFPIATPGLAISTDNGPIKTTWAIYDGERINSHGIPTEIGDTALLMGEVAFADTLKVGAWRHGTIGHGYYAVFDHQLTTILGAFARVGIAPHLSPDIYIDTGFRIGPGPFRPKDFISVGIAHAGATTGYETVIEATYQYLVRGWLTIQPDVQVLLDRNGTTGIVATRAVIAF
jgi:carbohydrate-selective porin OprB